jgi:hypothetical protein
MASHALSHNQPPYGPGILRDQGTDGKQRDTFHGRLCHQHAIERILVKCRQAFDGDSVIADDRQLAIAIVY